MKTREHLETQKWCRRQKSLKRLHLIRLFLGIGKASYLDLSKHACSSSFCDVLSEEGIRSSKLTRVISPGIIISKYQSSYSSYCFRWKHQFIVIFPPQLLSSSPLTSPSFSLHMSVVLTPPVPCSVDYGTPSWIYCTTLEHMCLDIAKAIWLETSKTDEHLHWFLFFLLLW